jgi:Zn-dependent protease
MLNLNPQTLIANLLTLIIALTIHEFSHAFVAVKFGDETPRMDGRLTLNPLKHLDPIGSIMLILAGFGWAKPVRVNPYVLSQKSPSALMWVSLAGPFSNFLLAVFAAIPFRFKGFLNLLSSTNAVVKFIPFFLDTFLFINLMLMLFNLLPLSPLDGEKIAVYILPPKWGQALEKIQPYGMFILIALLFVLPLLKVDVVGYLIYPVIYNLRYILAGLA